VTVPSGYFKTDFPERCAPIPQHTAGPLVTSPVVRRISVVGTSGSGKSHLARELAETLAVPFVELDAIFHQPGWVPLPADEFTARVAAATAGDGWVVDGNYSTVTRPVVWPRADTVIWFDLPRRVVMRQIVLRTIRRIAGHAELWNGNQERWRNFFTLNPDESVIAWAWTTHTKNRHRYREAALDPANQHLTFIRIASRSDARRLLSAPAGPR
jgi:adenylate kinase family enzyme